MPCNKDHLHPVPTKRTRGSRDVYGVDSWLAGQNGPLHRRKLDFVAWRYRRQAAVGLVLLFPY